MFFRIALTCELSLYSNSSSTAVSKTQDSVDVSEMAYTETCTTDVMDSSVPPNTSHAPHVATAESCDVVITTNDHSVPVVRHISPEKIAADRKSVV